MVSDVVSIALAARLEMTKLHYIQAGISRLEIIKSYCMLSIY